MSKGKHNKNKLSLIYDKRQKDFIVKYPRSSDGALIMNNILHDILEWDLHKSSRGELYSYNKSNLKDELNKRGYDLSTLKFSIELKEKLHDD